MLNQEETEDALLKFRDFVIQQSRSRLTRSKKNASKSLSNSLRGEVDVFKNSFSLDFFMEDYGQFVDQGVKGSRRSTKAPNSPFSFKNKFPPLRPIQKWIKQKGMRGRDEKGRFIKDKTLAFLIARSIFKTGIKPSLFFTKPFEQAFKKLPDELVESFGLDADKFLEQTLNTLPKQIPNG